MKKLLSIAALAAGTAMAGVGVYGFVKNSKNTKCSCKCCSDDDATEDAEDLEDELEE